MPIQGGTINAVAGQSTQNFSPPCPWCPLFDTPSSSGSKALVRAGNVFGRGSIQSVNRNGAKTSWQIVAAHGTHAPNTPSNYGFNSFEFWGPVIDQALVFGGGSAVNASDMGPYIRGIYSQSDTLRRLVASTMLVPGGTGKFVFDWGGTNSPILAKNGFVIFGAQDANNKQGLYLVRQTGGAVRKIIAVGDSIGAGFTVGGLNVGRGGFDGKTLVFTVGYTNFQGVGLYSTKVVPP